MNKKILNSKGVSLISLSIAVMIMLIVTGTIIYNVKDNLKLEKLEQMQQDIENLRDKISTYYSQYGDIPIKDAEYTNIADMQEAGIISQAVDTGKFYVIDLQAIENLTLTFGQDYENVKTLTDSAQISEYTNLYIINEDSHNIFYPHGIKIDEEVFYTNYTAEDVDTEPVVLININEIEDNWSSVYDINAKYIDKNLDEAIIPAGFKVSRTPGMDTIYDGLVISDEQGNEFVWVPVSKENFEAEFVRRAGYYDGSLQDISSYGEADSTGANTNSSITETTTTQAEAKEMYASVEKNGGFYIGRYEAGNEGGTFENWEWDDKGKVVVKKNTQVYNYISWADSDDMEDETGGVVELARKFDTDNEYTSVTSTLCYGVQWDTVLKFIDPGYTGYAKDSYKMGWYSDNYKSKTNGNIETNPNHITGKDLIYAETPNKISNMHKNIYDMGGNIREWTMETYSTNNRVIRGGYYNNVGSIYPASNRVSNVPSYTDANGIVGFRLALYINDNKN